MTAPGTRSSCSAAPPASAAGKSQPPEGRGRQVSARQVARVSPVPADPSPHHSDQPPRRRDSGTYGEVPRCLRPTPCSPAFTTLFPPGFSGTADSTLHRPGLPQSRASRSAQSCTSWYHSATIHLHKCATTRNDPAEPGLMPSRNLFCKSEPRTPHALCRTDVPPK